MATLKKPFNQKTGLNDPASGAGPQTLSSGGVYGNFDSQLPQVMLPESPTGGADPISGGQGNAETPRERGGPQTPQMPSPESRLGSMSASGGATQPRPRSPQPVSAGPSSPVSGPMPGAEGPASPSPFMAPSPRQMVGEMGSGGSGMLGGAGGLLGGGLGAPGTTPETNPTDLLLLLTQLLNQNG